MARGRTSQPLTFCRHFALLADYNQRMNRQLYDACAPLPPAVLEKDLGAFFRSILGTLNHLLVVDLLWLQRFATHRKAYESLQRVTRYPQPQSLDAIVFEHFAELSQARSELDSLLVFWLHNEAKEADFARLLTYTNRKGIKSTREFGGLVSHMFNHQTHHRGQVTTLLSQLGIDVGITDLLIDIPDQTRR